MFFLTELHPHVELHAQSLVDISLGDCAVTKRVLRILCRQTTQEFEFAVSSRNAMTLNDDDLPRQARDRHQES